MGKLNEKIIEPTVSNIGKKILIKILNDEITNIESISTVYHKINYEERIKITTIISKETYYEDV